MIAEPFGQVYAALWALLDSCAEFGALVQLGNRQRWDTETGTVAWAGRQASDLPMVSLRPTGTTVSLQATMDGVTATQRLALEALTGDGRLDRVLFPLKWVLCGCLLRANDTTLGLGFVRQVRWRDGVEQWETQAGRRQWRAVMHFEVEMAFEKDELAVTPTG